VSVGLYLGTTKGRSSGRTSKSEVTKGGKGVGTELKVSKLNGYSPVPKTKVKRKIDIRSAKRGGMSESRTYKGKSKRNKYMMGRGRLPPLLGNYQVGTRVPGFLGRNRLAHFGRRSFQCSFGMNAWTR